VDGRGEGEVHLHLPESFTLALSHLPGADAYASLVATPVPFNSLLAEIVAIALRGTSFNSTDGSRSYSGMENRVVDPVHEARTELGHDPEFLRRASELRRREAREKDEGERRRLHGERMEVLGELSEHAGRKYREVLGRTLGMLREIVPGVRVLRGGRVPRARYHEPSGGRELEGEAQNKEPVLEDRQHGGEEPTGGDQGLGIHHQVREAQVQPSAVAGVLQLRPGDGRLRLDEDGQGGTM
jgi:hypothetical protein